MEAGPVEKLAPSTDKTLSTLNKAVGRVWRHSCSEGRNARRDGVAVGPLGGSGRMLNRKKEYWERRICNILQLFDFFLKIQETGMLL